MWKKLSLKIKRLFCYHHLHWFDYTESRRICSNCCRLEKRVNKMYKGVRYSVWEEESKDERTTD